MVPKGRFELPQLAPHAPQACVSTNSTTSAKPYIYLSVSGWFCSACCCSTTGFVLSIMVLSELWLDIYANVKEDSIKTTAMIVVALPRNVDAPELPKNAWLDPPPPPNAAPISDPFPV